MRKAYSEIARIQDGDITVVVSIVHSPDDGGFYVQRSDLNSIACWVSERTYQSKAEARQALKANEIKWER